MFDSQQYQSCHSQELEGAHYHKRETTVGVEKDT